MPLPSTIIDLCDGLAAEMSTLLGEEVAREYISTTKRDDISELAIVVFPNAVSDDAVNRAQNRIDYQLNVLVNQEAKTKAVIDALVGMVMQIIGFWGEADGKSPTNGALRQKLIAGCSWVGPIESDPLWNADKLLSGEFLSITRIIYTYRGCET